MGSILSGFAILASVVDTPDVSYTPSLVLSPIANVVFGIPPFQITAFSDSQGAITYTVLSGPATIVNGLVTLTGIGTVTVSVNQQATSTFGAATVVGSFTVAAASPGLAFNTVPNAVYGADPFVISTRSASTGAVTYSVVSGPATISGQTVTITGAGTVVLQASQVAVGVYTAQTATSVFVVSPTAPTLALSPITATQTTGSQFTVTATSNSAGAITYSIASGPATISGGVVTITGSSGTVVVQASQAATANYLAGTTTTSITVT